MKTLEITLENCKKSPLKHLTETPIFAYFLEFVYNVLPKIVYLENSSTFTRIKIYVSLQPDTLLKKDSGAVVFLRLLRCF